MGKTRETISSDDSDMEDAITRLAFITLMLSKDLALPVNSTPTLPFRGGISGSSFNAYKFSLTVEFQTSYRAPDMFRIANSTKSSPFDYEELASDDKELWLIRLPQNVSHNSTVR